MGIVIYRDSGRQIGKQTNKQASNHATMSLPLEDIRHSFFNSLDHFPSDLVRTLWVCQSINIQLQQCDEDDDEQNDNTVKRKLLQSQQRKQSSLLSLLVKRQRRTLLRERDELNKQLHTRKRYNAFKSKESMATSTSTTTAATTTTTTTTTNTSTHTSSIIVEPRYCVCNDVAYGDMIACDNPQCPKEWFHYKCINMTTPPKNKWYCPDCKNNNNNNKKRKKGIASRK